MRSRAVEGNLRDSARKACRMRSRAASDDRRLEREGTTLLNPGSFGAAMRGSLPECAEGHCGVRASLGEREGKSLDLDDVTARVLRSNFPVNHVESAGRVDRLEERRQARARAELEILQADDPHAFDLGEARQR